MARRKRTLRGLGLPPEEHRILAVEQTKSLADLVESIEDAVSSGDCMGSYWMLMKANKMMGKVRGNMHSADNVGSSEVRKLERKITMLAEETGEKCVSYARPKLSGHREK
jgi:hypothetical protein